jgi:hypothetical protein
MIKFILDSLYFLYILAVVNEDREIIDERNETNLAQLFEDD